MSTSPTSSMPQSEYPQYAEFDLREMIYVLLRHKWLITLLVFACATTAALLSFFVLEPRYESTLHVTVYNPLSASSSFPMEYRYLGESVEVMRDILADTPLDASLEELADHFSFQFDEELGILTVKASAETAEEAHSLAEKWFESFNRNLKDYVKVTLKTRITAAGETLANHEEAYFTAQAALDTFEKQTPFAVLESRLAELQAELRRAEARERDLSLYQIPVLEAQVEFLKNQIEMEERTIGETDVALFPSVDPNIKSVVGNFTVLNPVYLQLNQDLANVEAQLSKSRSELGEVKKRLLSLPGEIDQLRQRIVNLETERTNLTNTINFHKPLWDDAKRKHTQLREQLRLLEHSLEARSLGSPTYPESPVAPRKKLNTAIAAFLGLFVGVGLAFFLEYWNQGVPASSGVTQ